MTRKGTESSVKTHRNSKLLKASIAESNIPFRPVPCLNRIRLEKEREKYVDNLAKRRVSEGALPIVYCESRHY